MAGKSALWAAGAAGLALLLAGLACTGSRPTSPPGSTPSTGGGTPSPGPTTVPAPTPGPTAVSTPPGMPGPVVRGSVRPGETVTGTLPAGGTEVWTFEAREGQYVTVWMIGAGDLDTYLELYDVDGGLAAEDDDSGEGTNSVVAEFPVVISGTYTVHALTYSGAGDYVLGLQVLAVPPGGVLGYGAVVQGVLPGLWSRHDWTFTGEEGNVVTIGLSATDGKLDCYLELYGPDGALLTDDDDSGVGYDALIEYYRLPADGAYHVVVRSGRFGEGGTYALTLDLGRMVVQGVLAYSDTVDAVLEPGTRHHWLFGGEEGDVVSISMAAAGGDMDTYLELFAPDGVRVMVDDDGGGGSDAAISGFTLPLGGTYRIIARGHGDEDVGGYTLTLLGHR